MTQRIVTVFCGSSPKKAREVHLKLAREAGARVVQAGYICRNGGGPEMMKEVCRGAVEAGGTLHGVVLNRTRYPPGHNHFTRCDEYDLLADRQRALIDGADGFLALPGGVGTAFEILDVVTRISLGEMAQRPIVCVKPRHFRALQVLLFDAQDRGFAYGSPAELVSVVDSLDEAMDAFAERFKVRGR